MFLFVFQTCQGQPTIHSCLNLNKPLRNNPLNLILDDNTATELLPKTSKQSEGICLNPNNDYVTLICLFVSPKLISPELVLFTAFFFLWLVKDAEANAPKKEDTGKQSLVCGPNEQTDVPHKGSGTRKQTKSGQRINGEKSKDRKYV